MPNAHPGTTYCGVVIKLTRLFLLLVQQKVWQTPAGSAPSPLTLPTVVADAQLLPGQVAVAVVGAPAVVSAVRDVARLAFPVLVTFTVHSTGGRVTRRALSMSRAVIGTGVDPERGQKGQQSISAQAPNLQQFNN